MRQSFEWLAGGQQGEGIDSTGELLARALVKYGYSVSTYKQFMSRIKGGHTNYKLKATAERNYYAGDNIDILLCLDKETLTKHKDYLSDGAVVIQEGENVSVTNPGEGAYSVFDVPLKSIASDLGNPLAKNMIAIGISAALIDLPRDILNHYIAEIFEKKGPDVISSNIRAVERGYELTNEHLSEKIESLEKTDSDDLLFISGNEATAFGSLMAGCRFLSAYPITPASEVMEWLAKELPAVGGTVMQVEDEIAGLCFAVGANYAGVRAMTSTSGPGISLKTEALGMAAMSEVPVVIVNSQRGGPSTGLPTKHEQSDLYHMIYGAHGEIPRMVLYPATIEDAFYLAAESFNLAEIYQCPVIIALDLGLSMNKMTIPSFNTDRVSIDRGKLLTADEAASYDESFFKRYRFTDDGISPRPLPGMPGALHLTSSNEHDESGYISEDPENRINMMRKRLEKVKEAVIQKPFKTDEAAMNCDVLFVGAGSSYGAIRQAAEMLNKDGGVNYGHLHLQQLYPLPVEDLKQYFENKKIISVENNYYGQILQVLKQHFPIHDRCDSILQFDGNPFMISSIISKTKEVV